MRIYHIPHLLYNLASGVVTTLCGTGTGAFSDGQGVSASFNNPCGITISPTTGVLYIADNNNHRIRVYATGNMLK